MSPEAASCRSKASHSLLTLVVMRGEMVRFAHGLFIFIVHLVRHLARHEGELRNRGVLLIARLVFVPRAFT